MTRLLKSLTNALYRLPVVKATFVVLAGAFVFLLPAAGVSSTAGFPGRNGTILASRGSKLYSISVDGRRTKAFRRIQVAKSWNAAQAAWSPDGTRIAFAGRGGGIFVADAGGTHITRIMRRGNAPAWSPDATRIVFALGDWLYLVRADGRGLSRLFRGRDPQWSPDGTQLAFEARDNGLSNIYVGSLDGSRRLRLTNAWSGECSPRVPGGAVYWNPEWSPDGRRIAFGETFSCASDFYNTIYASAPDGSNWEVLVEPTGNPESGGWAPVWAPDGSAIAYVDEAGVGLEESWGLAVLTFGRPPRVIGKFVPFSWHPRCNIGGRTGSDRLRGSSGPELICGFDGDDTITGDAGSDRLFGENGKDRFFARDGEFDVIGCGAGRDSVAADLDDLVGLDCEHVTRR